jgi:signal transduction histidine kinase
MSTPRDRMHGLLRLLTGIGEPPSLAHFGDRVCQLARRHLGVDAAALFVANDKGVTRVGSAGVAVPDGLDACADGFAGDWARANGFHRVECAPIVVDGIRAGALVLCSAGGDSFDAATLEALGAGLAQALGHLRSSREITGAFAKQEREQDQLLRAERMRALGDMALGIAHDFNNALNAMLGQLGVAEALVDPTVGNGAAARAALDKLRKVALDAAATIGRVQEFSGQRKDRQFDDVDLCALVEGAAAELRAARPDITVDSDCIAARVHGNADELADLLGALVDNAVEAMPSGGTLRLELSAAGDELALVVSDSGVGMKESVRRRAFDPFFTTKGSRIKGLGLAVAYGIARRHDATIELASTPGAGTRVRVRLPAARPRVAAVRPSATIVAGENGTASAKARRILLVEDDPDNRDAMAALLALSGFDVTPVDCGTAGMRAFAPDRFDVVLTDLGLPDMDGWQVAGDIKARAPSIPVALITGWGLNFDEDEIRRRGVDLLIKKPLEPRAFLRQLESLLHAGGRNPSA